jgi:dihydrodipicolinate synthase/N-acetylneuraminate lyase
VTVTVLLPQPDGTLAEHRLREPTAWARPAAPITARKALAACHVAADAFADNVPGAAAAVDWDATIAFRRHVWSYGLGVAEAMDTAQRGMGLDWPATSELIRRSAAAARQEGAWIAAGAGTDHVAGALSTLTEVTRAYEEQAEFVESAGAQLIVMASRQLAAIARGPDDYAAVYGKLLGQVTRPVILHWLGPMFDPALAGYWGTPDLDRATEILAGIVTEHHGVIDGVKVSLLDADRERELRAALPGDVRVYTGDDFNYAELIRGDSTGSSDALLGIFASIAPAASAALQALDRGDLDGYDAALAPTVPLARHLFSAPTYFYKTGIAFLAWICGYQDSLTMLGGLQSARSTVHLARAFRLADEAGLIPDPELAVRRLSALLTVGGITP